MSDHDIHSLLSMDDDALARLAQREAGSFLEGSEATRTASANDERDASVAWLREALPGYRPLGEIGRGGMGVVIEAEELRTGRIVAVKTPHAHLLTRESVRQLQSEAAALARVSHDCVARLLGVVECAGPMEGALALVMERVRGQSVERWLENSPPVRDRVRLMRDVADAIAAAHAEGVLHLDLKPGNVLVCEDGRPKVLDFGVAHVLAHARSDATLTLLTSGFGTIEYMAPEQLDARVASGASDVYAMGAMLYRLLSGRPPVEVRGLPVSQATERVRTQTPAPLRRVTKTISRDLEMVASVALQKEPQDRYPSAAALRDDLDRCLARRPITARRTSAITRGARLLRRHPRSFGGAALVALALASAAGIAATQAHRARLAEAKASHRAAALEEVVRFQAESLSNLNPHKVGESLRSAIEAQVSDDAPRDLLNGVAFTDATLLALRENLLEPTLLKVRSEFQDQPLVRARLLHAIAETMESFGLVEDAVTPQREALTLYLATAGERHPDALRAKHRLGALLRASGNWAEAAPLLQDAADGLRAALGPSEPDSVLARAELAFAHQQQSDYPNAEREYAAALRDAVEHLPADHPARLSAVAGMGWMLHHLGRLDEAEPLMREALDGRRRSLGDSHLKTLESMIALGGLLRDLKRYEEAEAMMSLTVAKMTSVLGHDHPRTLAALNHLGAIFAWQHRDDEAIPYYTKALEGQRRTLGDVHAATLLTMSNLSAAFRRCGRLEEAEALGADAVARAREHPPGEQWWFGMFLSNQSKTLFELRRYAEAETTALEADAILVAALGEGHLRSVVLAEHLAMLYSTWGRHAPGQAHNDRALEWEQVAAARRAARGQIWYDIGGP